jgi:hypothetical protein
MALTTYAELQTAIGNYLHRSDLTAVIPDFVSLAEAKFKRTLRLRAMENIATGTISSSVALPTGFIEMISITASRGSNTYPLTYIPPSQINSVASSANFYSIVGDNIYFVPTGSGQTYTLTYYKSFDPLSSSVNWLMTNAPDVYLYASLLEAAPYIKDDARVQTWAQLLVASVDQLKKSDDGDRYGYGLVMRAA